MDFDQLKTFTEVARLGSFSRAAEKVLRSQPAVSAQIRQLEEEYGQKLFDRTAKAVRLTPAGEVVLEYAQQLLALRHTSRLAISDWNGKMTGTLSLGANEGTFLYVLPKVLEKYHRKYPTVRISVYRNFTQKVSEKVEDGVIDVGVVTMPVRSPSLKVVPVFKDRILLMVGRSSPLFQRNSATLEEFAREPIIVPKTGSIRKMIEKNLRPYREHLKITMELTSLTMIKRFVAAGFGVSLIAASFARENVRRGEVKLLTLEGLDQWRELGLVYRKDRSLPRVASAFLEMAASELGPKSAA
ncbi:MAG TPA: LysR family transcriptional regulator [Verrucomicrobiae bacterium]|jgi:DNA-binding transcriptional LysR family regulator|nr:LysR family transcriptional regulator [Verrucomicrobiae bacterium]